MTRLDASGRELYPWEVPTEGTLTDEEAKMAAPVAAPAPDPEPEPEDEPEPEEDDSDE
jgi:hypothetical protein